MTRFPILPLAVAIAFLAVVPTAGAASIAYIAADGNVHLVSPDGARDKQLTTNATADNKYRSPSQIDDGRVVALRRADGSTAFAFFLRPGDGQVLDAWLLPKSGAGGFSPYSGAQASPDGGMIAYDYRHFDCATNPCQGNQRVGFSAGPGQTNPCLINCHVGFVAPRWVPGTPYAAMIDQSFKAVYVQQQGSPQPVGWFQYGGEVTIEGLDVRANRILTSVSLGGNEYMVAERMNGAPPALPQSQCSVNMPDGARPRLSPDGSMVAWSAPEGVMVSPTPAQTGGTGTLCQLTPKLIAAGGSQPEWGPADVPAPPADPQGPPPETNPTPKATGRDAKTADVKPPEGKLTEVVAPKLEKALASGFAVGFRCAEACKAKAAAGVAKGVAKRLGFGTKAVKVGSGRASLPRAGSGQVRISFTPGAREKLETAGSVPLTVTLTLTDAAGNKRQLSRALILKR